MLDTMLKNNIKLNVFYTFYKHYMTPIYSYTYTCYYLMPEYILYTFTIAL